MVQREVLEYYGRGGERRRLGAGAGRLEFLRTWDVLGRELPAPPASVLDVGGGMGVYAGPLAAAGYDVRLVEPVPEHVAAAAELPGVTAELGDARDLRVADASVDAVLLLGPLYHLADRAERLTVWREPLRVVRPGGVVVAAAISRHAALFDGFVKGYLADPDYDALVDSVLAEGVISGERRYFTSAYLHRPGDAVAEAAEAGLAGARSVVVEGPMAFAGAMLEELLADPVRTAQLLDRMRQVEADPGLAAATGHLLVLGRRAQR